MFFVYDIFYGMEQGCTVHFRHKKIGWKIVVPPVVNLRHAKVV